MTWPVAPGTPSRPASCGSDPGIGLGPCGGATDSAHPESCGGAVDSGGSTATSALAPNPGTNGVPSAGRPGLDESRWGGTKVEPPPGLTRPEQALWIGPAQTQGDLSWGPAVGSPLDPRPRRMWGTPPGMEAMAPHRRAPPTGGAPAGSAERSEERVRRAEPGGRGLTVEEEPLLLLRALDDDPGRMDSAY